MTLAGIPLVLLCALRASNNFSELIVATSNESSDDYLANILLNEDIKVYRGSLKNVLSRFNDISYQYNLRNEDTIVRLTGDNPIVDAKFLKLLKSSWESEEIDYFSAEPLDMENSNWPKGLSAEFFKVGLLRDSFIKDKSDENLEHVTTYIRKNASKKAFGNNLTSLKFKKKLFLGVDRLEDYKKMQKIFEQNKKFDTFDKIIQNLGA
jgi:spore coat polysaccharide biosynthesis protein SpsF